MPSAPPAEAAGGGVRVRQAGPSDRPCLVGFVLRCAWDSEREQLDRSQVERGVAEVLRDPRLGRYLLAEAEPGGAALGSLLVTPEWSDWRGGSYWWIQSVFVDPRHRQKNVYKALHARVLADARRSGALGVRLYVHRENRPARDAYRRLGMRPSAYLLYEHVQRQ